MQKKLMALLCCLALMLSLMAGCAKESTTPTTEAAPVESTAAPTTAPVETTAPAETEQTEPEEEVSTLTLKDGTYLAEFDTDSSMFHVNETKNKIGILTVVDGKMTIHVALASKGILNLFPGTAEDAQKDGAELLEPTEETVTYEDGSTEEVYAYDIPVPYLDEEFDCALVGKKATWYDHKVSVSNVRRIAPEIAGNMTMEVTLSGGSGKAHIDTPAQIVKAEDGELWAVIVWSSKNYEYMLVDGIQYDPIQEPEQNSTFLIPIVVDEEMAVSGLTVAMSNPHLIDYTLLFDSSTLQGE